MSNTPRLYRLRHIIGDATATPPIPAIIPVSRTTFLHGVAMGRYPAPIRIGDVTFWRSADIEEFIANGGRK